jgi:hypothetical protein
MNYKKLINIYAKQKVDLGMSESYIAEQTCLSQPTVHRIFTGQHDKAAWNDMIEIGKVLGIELCPDGFRIKSAKKMVEEQAENLANIITRITQATSQMEGQGLSQTQKRKMVEEAKIRLLAGSRRKLWMEE